MEPIHRTSRDHTCLSISASAATTAATDLKPKCSMSKSAARPVTRINQPMPCIASNANAQTSVEVGIDEFPDKIEVVVFYNPSNISP